MPVHGFGQDGNSELYALATNTSANGNGGVVYKLASIRLTAHASGNLLDLSWPVAGGRLQAQANGPGLGLGTNWSTVPGSTTNTLYNNAGTLTWGSTALGVASGWSTGSGIVYTSTSTDNVGIGDSTPDAALEVQSTASETLFAVSSGLL